MMTKIYRWVLCGLLGCMLAAWSGKEFTIEGNIENLGTQNIGFAWYDNGHFCINWMPAVDGQFAYKSSVSGKTVVEIYTRQMELIARAVISNGIDVKLSGHIKAPDNIEADGSKINRRWSEWLAAHASSLQNGDRQAIEAEVERYVSDNPDDLLSGLLLAYHYANGENRDATLKLLENLDDDAKPEYITARIDAVANGLEHADATPIANFALYSTADSIEMFDFAKSRLSLLYFWAPASQERNATVDTLRKLYGRYTRQRLQLADITLSNDSMDWKFTVRKDSVKWKQFWALSGRMNSQIRRMGVDNAPYFIVADSAGTKLYGGTSLDAAKQQVEKSLKKK